jgi:hypothetical protein
MLIGVFIGAATVAAVIKSDLPRRVAARLEAISIGLISAEPDEATITEEPANDESKDDLGVEQSVGELVELADEVEQLPEK